MTEKKNEVYELEKLTKIDDPKLAKKMIKVRAVVASNSNAYNVPAEIIADCVNEEEHDKCPKHRVIPIYKEMLVGFVDIKDEKRFKLLNSLSGEFFGPKCKVEYKEIKWITVKRLRLRPVVSSLVTKDSKFFDIEGNEWKFYDVYVLQNDAVPLEAGKEIEIIGKVIPDPNSQRITLVVSSAKESDSLNYGLDKIASLREHHSSMTTDEIMNWYADEFEKYSKIRKRKNVTICNLLTAFSLNSIPFDGETIPGWVKSLVIGDSTTGKSHTSKKAICLLENGQILSAENASMVGLSATAVQSTNNQWFVEWGPLVLQDRKMLIIDGAHKLKGSDWSAIAEVEREGRISLNKAAKGEAYARTRQLKIMNPTDGNGAVKTMDSFLYPVESLQNNLEPHSIARQDLVVFVSDNISPEERISKFTETHDEKLEYISELLKLVWKQDFAVEFDDEAKETIWMNTINLEKKFKYDKIPLVNNDQKHKLIRLSASVAALTCSYNNDFTKLLVKKEHVEYITRFIETEYHNAGLDTLASRVREEEVDSEMVAEIITDIMIALSHKRPRVNEQYCRDVLRWIVERDKLTKAELQTKFDLARENELDPLISTFKDRGIIRNGQSGFIRGSMGVKIARYLIKESNEERVSGFTDTRNTKNAKGEEPGVPSVPDEPETASLGEQS